MIAPQIRLLLVSNSTVFGGTYLGHVLPVLQRFLAGVPPGLFIPHALQDHAGYAEKACSAFEGAGIPMTSLHGEANPIAAVARAGFVFTGGGNTFRLLKALQDRGLIPAIHDRVSSGMPYVGSSAGSNIAAPTIRTTNDMPIVEPASLSALNLVPFQINPHYLDPDPGSRHMGETREERLVQYLEENERPVVGLREGAWIRVEKGAAWLEGTTGARIFRKGWVPAEREPGESLSDLFPAAP